jgi:hypothetical protein
MSFTESLEVGRPLLISNSLRFISKPNLTFRQAYTLWMQPIPYKIINVDPDSIITAQVLDCEE